MTDVIFVGGIEGKKKWLENGKKLSRNYRQGNRVYSVEGIATTLTSEPIGGTGGYTSLYLVEEEYEKESDKLTNINREVSKQKPFTYVSLFSGIGGFEQALNKLGGTCVFASEYDPEAKTQFNQIAYEVLYGYKPDGDIRLIDEKDIPDHDLLVGGFPCQAFSVAGQRKGFEDTRGTLFFEIARIAAEKKPKALLLENVKGLVNHRKGETLDTMIRVLNDIGYVIDFEVLNSKYFGVPQNRERVFIIAIREDLIEVESFNEETTKGNTIVPKRKRQINEWANVFNFDWPEHTEVTTRLRDILEPTVDEKYYLDEKKTAKLVAQLTRETEDGFHAYRDDAKKSSIQGTHVTYAEGRTHALTVAHMPITNAEPQMLGHIDIRGNDSIKRTYSTEGISPTLTTMSGGHREPKIAEAQTPVQYNRKDGIGKELEQANTLSASDWRGLNRNQNQNAVLEEIRPVLTPDRMEKRQNGRRFKDDGEESFTLTSQDRHGVALGNPAKYRIRKLTPRECWRLQGFPDEAHDAVMNAGISDSQRYKMAGNAVTVNVIESIAERLIPYIEK